MAQRKDKVVDGIAKIRRGLSERLLKARRRGREFEELQAIAAEGRRWYRSEGTIGKDRNGRRNGKKASDK